MLGLWTFLLVVLTSFVFAADPVINEASIESPTFYMNDTLKFYVNGSDSDNDNLTFQYRVYRNDELVESYDSVNSHTYWLYQENPTTANYTQEGAGNGRIILNYSKPDRSKSSSRWMVRIGAADKANFTMGFNCWYEFSDKLSLSLRSLNPNTTSNKYSYAYCLKYGSWHTLASNYRSTILTHTTSAVGWSKVIDGDWSTGVHMIANGDGWQNHYSGDVETMMLFEEGMWWYISTTWINNEVANLINLSPSSVNDTYIYEIRAHDGGNYSNWTNSSSVTIQSRVPVFNQSGFTHNSIHHLGVSLQVNATDPDGSNITHSINDTRFTINLSSGWINRTTSQSDVGVYNVTVGANDGYGTANMSFIINITNTAPTLSNVIISPSPADNLDNLTCLNNSAPYDENGDAVTFQYRWYKESIDQNITAQTLGSGNTSIGENWTCSITSLDGLDNGTEVSSQIVQIGQAEVSPTILSTNATTNGQNISNSTQPTEYADNLTLAVSFSDPNNNTFQAFFCKTSGGDADGCTGQTWCNTSLLSSTEVSCNANISGTSLDTTYNYFVYVVDNTSKISSAYMNSFYIGDETIPSIYGDSLSANSGVNNAPVTIYVTVYDENTISSVFVEVTDPNTAKQNYSMSGSGNGEYSKVFTPSTDGSYSFNFFVSDQSGNENSLASSLTYTDSTQTIQGGGGGGGTTINMYGSNKRVCNIEAKPSEIRFAFAKTIKEITILNKDNESFSPTFKKINLIGELADNFEIQNAISTILPDREDSFGITFTPDYVFEPGEVVISLTSDNCKDINITLSVSEELRSTSIFEDFFAGRMSLTDLIFENVFSESNSYRKVLPWLTVGIVAAIMFAIIVTLLLGQIIKSFNERTYIRTVLWVFFIFISSAVATIFTVAGIRTL